MTKAIASAQAGDRGAIHFLYVRYADDVERYVRSFVGDYQHAEDVTQNVFFKLPTSIKKYERREVPFVAWLLRVARNAAMDHLRTREATPCEEIRQPDNGNGGRGHVLRVDLIRALDRLPTDQREVVVLRHIVGLSPNEIASTLEKSESAVHGLHHRGRLTLQAALRDFGATPVVMANHA